MQVDRLYRIFWFGLCLIGLSGTMRLANAKPEFLALVKKQLKIKPGGKIDSAKCALCHTSVGKFGWNPFGNTLKDLMEKKHVEDLSFSILKEALSKDSDGDGFTNAEEFAADTLPGDPRSKPKAHVKLKPIFRS